MDSLATLLAQQKALSAQSDSLNAQLQSQHSMAKGQVQYLGNQFMLQNEYIEQQNPLYSNNYIQSWNNDPYVDMHSDSYNQGRCDSPNSLWNIQSFMDQAVLEMKSIREQSEIGLKQSEMNMKAMNQIYLAHKFNAQENDWSVTSFASLKDLDDTTEGFSVNDTLLFETERSDDEEEECCVEQREALKSNYLAQLDMNLNCELEEKDVAKISEEDIIPIMPISPVEVEVTSPPEALVSKPLATFETREELSRDEEGKNKDELSKTQSVPTQQEEHLQVKSCKLDGEIIEDGQVKVDKSVFPVDFIFPNFEEVKEIPKIFGQLSKYSKLWRGKCIEKKKLIFRRKVLNAKSKRKIVRRKHKSRWSGTIKAIGKSFHESEEFYDVGRLKCKIEENFLKPFKKGGSIHYHGNIMQFQPP